ncbi:Acetyltransferase [Shewanella piezotolerans WP3]|uniref:Acetyltransferase n=1 Tax=Shewanella piezotolerans (strain WP3 / JCM 13877) TaxID=225849 RepID=B8CL48_SHEPW|nr:hypothetical protein [Shewanella piezotolerans]ACJ28374.1 Acetyltransferase [Shewanella piezotolerans WP3]
MNYDVFNGDADGIIALLQLRLASPADNELVTGVKRDIALLQQVPCDTAKNVTVLDISMEKNSAALAQLLANKVDVFYADHHRSGVIADAKNLDAHIDLNPDTCTALIIDRLLQGQFHLWAITAAYGDNLIKVADDLAEKADLSTHQAELLKELGTLINYNGYGAVFEDLHFHPAELFSALLAYESPFEVLADIHSPYHKLQTAYAADMNNALAVESRYSSETVAVYELADAAWARRISGVYGNLLANNSPDKAHIVLTENKDNSYTASLRAPLTNKQGAGDVCSQFNTGGGRAAAAGINNLAVEDISGFIKAVETYYSKA